MKKIVALLCLVVWCYAGASEKASKEDVPRFNFMGINVSQVIQLIYSEALKGPFVIEPDVLSDQRSVSFRYDPSAGELRPFIVSFLDSLGLVVTRRNGVDFVSRKVPPAEKAPEVRDVYVYRPRFRDGSYLVDLLSPLFKGEFTARRTVHAASVDKSPQFAAPAGSAAASIDRKSDMLVFVGPQAEIKMLKNMLAQVDTSAGDVLVRGVLYEVQTGRSDGTGFSLALNVLGGKLGVNVGASTSKNTNSVTFSSASIEAAVTALATDSRFTVKSAPTLRVASGQNGRFTVGQDVPVLGAVTYNGNSAVPVQSVEYRSSGVIFELLPVLHADAVDLTVMQQVSNFSSTLTGVNNSPTLTKRELKTSLTVADGELIVIGGLAEDKQTDSNSGLSFLPDFMRGKTMEKSKSEILLILQLTRI